MKKIIIGAICAALLSGCGHVPTRFPDQLATWNVANWNTTHWK